MYVHRLQGVCFHGTVPLRESPDEANTVVKKEVHCLRVVQRVQFVA